MADWLVYLKPFIPIFHKEKNFDLVINTGSFQEMMPEIVKGYIDMIQNQLHVSYLYSCNYGRVDGFAKEASFWGELPIDDKWEVIYKAEDNPIIRIDTAQSRHFLETFIKRLNNKVK